MGIRFYCSNGHKIHVKSHLAGRRGFCPKCGEKVDIPAQSASSPPVADNAPNGANTATTNVSVSTGLIPPTEQGGLSEVADPAVPTRVAAASPTPQVGVGVPLPSNPEPPRAQAVASQHATPVEDALQQGATVGVAGGQGETVEAAPRLDLSINTTSGQLRRHQRRRGNRRMAVWLGIACVGLLSGLIYVLVSQS